MEDFFHEARVALNTAKIEYTSISSLSSMGIYAVNQACENSVRAIWEITTKSTFPHNSFKPFHKPAKYLREMGLLSYYSPETQKYLDKLTGYAPDEIRYDSTQAYRDYTKSPDTHKGKELITGAEKFIKETEELIFNGEVQKIIKTYKDQVDKNTKTP